MCSVDRSRDGSLGRFDAGDLLEELRIEDLDIEADATVTFPD